MPVDQQQYQLVGRVVGLGNQRQDFERFLNNERRGYGQGNWEMVHVVEMDGQEVWLTNAEFIDQVYIPAVREWLRQLPQALFADIKSIFEWVPGDAEAYLAGEPLETGVPLMAVAVSQMLREWLEIEAFQGTQEISLSADEQVVPNLEEIPEELRGLPYSILFSPVIISVMAGIRAADKNLPIINQDFQQFDEEYFEKWTQRTFETLKKFSATNLVLDSRAKLETVYQNRYLAVARRILKGL